MNARTIQHIFEGDGFVLSGDGLQHHERGREPRKPLDLRIGARMKDQESRTSALLSTVAHAIRGVRTDLPRCPLLRFHTHGARAPVDAAGQVAPRAEFVVRLKLFFF